MRLTLILAAAVPGATLPLTQDSQSTRAVYAVYVSSHRSQCSYQTGDVIFDADGFRADLKLRFDPQNDIIIFHDRTTRRACIEKASAIARHLRFHNVRAEVAPENLNMGPPTSVP